MNIKENKGKVIIDKFKIEGFIYDEKHDCGTNIVYYEKYDSEFCPKCNIWIANLCSDKNCVYCKNRPEKPLNSK